MVILAFILNPMAKRRRLREAEKTGEPSLECRNTDLEERGVGSGVLGNDAGMGGSRDESPHSLPRASARSEGASEEHTQTGLPTPFGAELGRGA